ncbi:polysaccharide deacetylase family protein [Natranaerobius thermophilus]|uniref:Polysaccharide deacetylase n=1 Tax=Natranaerobius thermophilus (strain ATCC BAA-1301 / DSM 18059 / JW/NM-WN-LF) TaxID=457570 RepID=B2A0R6_NATTJ|nr:polysaccharide deacetylase family protein [Natranaerobius thermophilus]ACB85946.1 polysaccharide deacetylase [Natranaerobius thermophilus JW/NM-WN-LF]
MLQYDSNRHALGSDLVFKWILIGILVVAMSGALLFQGCNHDTQAPLSEDKENQAQEESEQVKDSKQIEESEQDEQSDQNTHEQSDQDTNKPSDQDTKIPVLMYHHFDDDPETSATITPDMLEKQMEFLDKHGFSAISMEDLLRFIEDGDDNHLPDRPVLITIDDGYASTYEQAIPILEEYGFNSYIFMITERIGKQVGEYDFLSKEKLKDLEDQGHSIESHSVSHDPFTDQKEGESTSEWRERIGYELEKSKQVLEDKLNKEIRYFAYPFGDWNSHTEELVEKAGYEATFLVREDYVTKESHPQRLFRFGITKDMTMEEFKEIFEPVLNEEEPDHD